MNPWERSYAFLHHALGASVTPESIVRVEVRRGGHLVWHIHTQGTTHWMQWKRGCGKFLTPWEDQDLPIFQGGPFRISGRTAILAYRPGRRVVWRDAQDGWIGKAYRSHRDRPAVRHLERVRTALQGDPVVRLPALQAQSSTQSAFGLEPLMGLTPSLTPTDGAVWRQLGRGIARMQQQVPVEGLSLHGALDEVELLGSWRPRYLAALGELPSGWDRAFVHLQSAARTVRSGPPVACHRDLHDHQILWDGERLGWLDWDLLCGADAALDLGNLTAHFLLRAMQGERANPNGEATALARHLLEGYAAEETERFFTALRFYQASTLLRLALLYDARPRWRYLPPELVLHAEQALKDLSHA